MNSSLKKTIQINPELFKIQTSSKSKTKSNREKKSKPEKPITPNFLKKQLIDRIKNYKKNTNNLTDDIKENISSDKEEDDEFILSMNFLSSISNDKEKPLTNKVTYKTDLISSPNLEITELKETKFSPSSQNVNVDLPIELVDIKQSEIEINEDIPILKEQSLERNITTNLVSDNVPYGCLKNGSKPTYRSWLTQKNNYSNKPVVKEKENIVEKENIPITEREKKLNELKYKFKNEEPTYIKKIIKKKIYIR